MFKLVVGDVISCDSHGDGEIIFCGPCESLEPAGATWYGIRLTEEKGDMNGKVDGHLFFKCPEDFGVMLSRFEIEDLKVPFKGTRITVGDSVTVPDRNEDGVTVQGEIKFVGPVFEFDNGAETWYGIELDERCGDTDGSVQGTRYFNCQSGYGQFIRMETLHATTRGMSILDICIYLYFVHIFRR